MIRRICCVCGIEHAPPIDDGREEVVYSHGYCERHYDEVMMQIAEVFPSGRMKTVALERREMFPEFAELPAEGARSL